MKKILRLPLPLLLTGCITTWHSATQDVYVKSHKPTYSASNRSLEEQLPLKVDVSYFDEKALSLSGPEHSELNEKFDYSVSDHQLKNAARALELDLLPNKIFIKAESEDPIFESTHNSSIEALGWSFTDPVFAYRSNNQLYLVDFRSGTPRSIEFGDREIQFLPSGGALLKKPEYLDGQGEIIDRDFRVLHQFEIKSDYTSNGYLVTLHFDSQRLEIESSNSLYFSSEQFCIDEERKTLKLDSVEFNLETHDLYSSQRNCKGMDTSPTDPNGLYRDEIVDRYEVWQFTLDYQVVESTAEIKTFNWECDENSFLVGEVTIEYTLQLSHPDGHQIDQSGALTVVYDEPVCRQHSD